MTDLFASAKMAVGGEMRKFLCEKESPCTLAPRREIR